MYFTYACLAPREPAKALEVGIQCQSIAQLRICFVYYEYSVCIVRVVDKDNSIVVLCSHEKCLPLFNFCIHHLSSPFGWLHRT